jgi:hypothetical protein
MDTDFHSKPVEAPVSAEPVKEVIDTDSFDSEVKTTPGERAAVKKPLLYDILDLREIYNTFDVKKETKEVDKFILSEMERLHLEDTDKNYEKVYIKIIKNLSLDSKDRYDILAKICEYIKIQEKIRASIQEREELLKKDPSELTAEQIKKQIELKNE